MSNKSGGESRHSYLDPDIMGKEFGLSPLSVMVAFLYVSFMKLTDNTL